jgi:hypothetical protein
MARRKMKQSVLYSCPVHSVSTRVLEFPHTKKVVVEDFIQIEPGPKAPPKRVC